MPKQYDISKRLAEEAMKILNASGDAELASPWRELFGQFKTMCNAVLTKLPGADDEAWNGEFLASCLNALSSATSLIGSLSDRCRTMESQMASIKNAAPSEEVITAALAKALPGEIEKAIKAKIEAKELLPMTVHNGLVDAAKALGVTEGQKTLREQAEQEAAAKAKSEARSSELVKNGLPGGAPANVLALSDADFQKASDTAKTRFEALSKAGLPKDHPEMLRIYAGESDYGLLESLVKTLAPAPRTTVDPLAKAAPAAEPSKPKTRIAPL